MADQDFQLEELENDAVNKSNNAKRIAAAAGLAAGSAAAGFAASHFTSGGGAAPDAVEEPEVLSEEDLESVANTGVNQVQSQPVTPQPQPRAQAPQQEQPTEEEVDLSFTKTTEYFAGEDLVMTEEEGMLDGRKFKLVDIDGDLRADYLAYDEDGNGVYNDDEVIELNGSDKIAMGHTANEHEVVRIYAVEPNPQDLDPYAMNTIDIDNEKDYPEAIRNDFEDEKTGENYSHDYAENNENYNNNGDVEAYNASYTEPEMAYQEEDGEQSDYDFLAEDNAEESTDTFESDSFDIV